MVVVHSGIMQSQLQKIVESCHECHFRFVKKDGIKLYFEADIEDEDKAAAIAKKAIKSDPIGGTLLVSVKTEK